MALSIDEIIRLRNRLAAQRIANEAMADAQRQQAQTITPTLNVPGGGERETSDPRNPFAAAGMGALKFLDTLAAGGGGGVRRAIQGFQPGEQSVERELREISQERGPTRNPWESFKRQGEASRRTEDTHLWDTPFDFAAKGSRFNPFPFSYLPQNVTSRGLAEVAGDPLNLAVFAPFIGAPLRAAEGAVFGAAKGALSGTLGSVGRGLGAGGGKRTLGSVAKGVAAAPTRGLGRAVTEAGRGASRSLDIERRLLGRNIFGRNTVKPPAAALDDLPPPRENSPVFNKLPFKDKITQVKIYAGIGSRQTPKNILSQMREVAKELQDMGYTLRSGDAKGADSAFAAGAGQRKQIFTSRDATDVTRSIAKEIHPLGQKLTLRQGLNLHARNTNQIFGRDLDTPADFVLAWTPGGKKTGGTAQALEMAEHKGIPIINLADPKWRSQLSKVIGDQEMAATPKPPSLGDFSSGTAHITDDVLDGVDRMVADGADVAPDVAKEILGPTSRSQKAFGIFKGPGFRETFGRSRLGVSFAERISGLKGIIANSAEGPKRQVAKILDRFNVRLTIGSTVVDNKATAFRAANRESTLKTDAETDTWFTDIFVDKDGNTVPWEKLSPEEQEATLSTHIYETLGKYYNKELKDFDVPTDGSLIVVKELPEEIKTWAQKSENGYEVSSKGDKRFSAFYAKLKNGKSVELTYQQAKGYTSAKAGKGKPAIDPNFNYWGTYLKIWKDWARENPELMDNLRKISQGKVLTDRFATSENNQANALATILNEMKEIDIRTGEVIPPKNVVEGDHILFSVKRERYKTDEIKGVMSDTVKYKAKMSRKQALLYGEMLNYFEDGGKHAFKRQIEDLVRRGTVKYTPFRGKPKTVKVTNEEEAWEVMKQQSGIDGMFVPHMWKQDPNYVPKNKNLYGHSENDLWDGMGAVSFTRERMGRKESLEKPRQYTTLEAAKEIREGQLTLISSDPGDLVDYYGKQVIKVRTRDNLEKALRLQWIKMGEEDRERWINTYYPDGVEGMNYKIEKGDLATNVKEGGWSDRTAIFGQPNYIYINVAQAKKEFAKKIWAKKDDILYDEEGNFIRPLPSNIFKTYRDYEEYLIEREKVRLYLGENSPESANSFENRMSMLALAKMEKKRPDQIKATGLIEDSYAKEMRSLREKNPGFTRLELQAKAFLKVSEDITQTKLLERHFNVRARGGWNEFTKTINEEIFGPLRGLRAGIDFGFMGINTLPLLFIRPLDYARVWKRAYHSLWKDKYEKYVWDNLDDFDDMASMGITLNKYSTDVYDSLRSGAGPLGVFGRFPGGRRNIIETKLVGPVQERLERAFYGSMDDARHYLYKSYKPLWENITDPAERALLRESLSEFINYSTGGFSAAQQGISPTQRDLEASWIFFSPRYTRASLALIAKAFGGDVGGVEARRIMTNALTVAVPIYIHTARSLGQEPDLDPTSGAFLTIKIDGDYIGPATFFRQFATLTARLIADPEAVAFMDDRPGVTFKDSVFNNPIIKFFRGRTPISTSLATDLATGSDFLGQELETPVDWSKHFAGQALPFWAEGIVFNNGFDRAGIPAIVSEILGARSFPSSPYNKRSDLREIAASDEYGMEWEQLTDNEKLQIKIDYPELSELDEQVRELRMGRDEGFDRLLEEKTKKLEAIDNTWNETVRPVIEGYANGDRTFSLGDIAKVAKEASRNRRRARREVEKDEKYEPIDKYFKDRRDVGDMAQQHADFLVSEYYRTVIEASEKPLTGMVDYGMRDKLQRNFFRENPGMEEYLDTSNYLRNALSTQPPLLAEYYDGLEKFRYYWEGSENAVFNTTPNFESIRPLYERWQNSLEDTQTQLELESPELVELIATLKRVREAMRKQDMLLDRFLVRWQIGGVRKPKHPHNILVYGDDIEKGREPALLAHNYDWRIQDMP